MDWPTIVAALTSSAALTAAIMFASKQALMRAIDLRFEEMKAERVGRVTERTRRAASLFDQQLQAYRTILAGIGIARGEIKDLIARQSARSTLGSKEEISASLAVFEESLQLTRSVRSERVLLPKNLYEIAHRTMNRLIDVHSALRELGNATPAKRRQYEARMTENFAEALREIQHEYDLLTGEVRMLIGLVEEVETVIAPAGSTLESGDQARLPGSR